MSAPLYVDISAFQGAIDFHAYCAWAKQGDGIARIAMKSTEGVSFTDPCFATNRAGALAAGIDVVIFYHYGWPDLGNSPESEADYQQSILGNLREQDVAMLDYEVDAPAATAEWAYHWLARQEQNYGGRKPTIYASDSYIRQRLQDNRLARYPLTLANWQFTPTERPACPPWSTYTSLQYTNKATSIPGISGAVDADIYLEHDGGSPPSKVPAGWHDDGTTLTAPNGVPVIRGFRAHILNAPSWDAGNQPCEPEYHTEQVLLHNAAVGAGQRQCFRDGLLWYTEAKGVVWEPYLGLELDAAYRQFATLQAQTPPATQPGPS